MKVIFLDIDGVLNTSQTFIDIYYEWKKTGVRRVPIDEFRLVYLKEIIDKTKALIILSSSWRAFFKKENGAILPINDSAKELVHLLNKYNLEIHDITPRDKNGIRQNEIKKWLSNHIIDNFVVIDDDSYDLKDFINKELVKTNFAKDREMIQDMSECCGLCESHVSKIVNILNNKTKKITK